MDRAADATKSNYTAVQKPFTDVTSEKLGGYEEAVKRYHGNLSPRAKKLIAIESWVKCTQYTDRQSWWSLDVPLQERAPCVIYPVARIAASSNTDMVLGEGRYPELTTKIAEDEADDENGLSAEESKEIDRFIREYHRVSRFKAGARESFYAGQHTGSAACIHGVRNGKPFQDLIPAKWCEPELDQEGNVLKLVIQYPYLEQYQDQAGDWCVKTKLYRRVIDENSDIEFFPADAPESKDSAKVVWKKNPSRSVEHKLGFCPVIWYPFMRGCQPINVVDGEAIHAGLFQEIEAHDFAVSMRHRAALYAGDPQWVEIGVEPGYNPSDGGRTPVQFATPAGGKATDDNPVVGAFQLAPRQARKRGSTQVFQYENPDAKAQLITLPGDALEAVDSNARDLRMKLQEALAVVFLDPENIKFAVTTSGKALAAIKQRQLDRCDQYRDDFADKFFEPSVSMQLRIAYTIMKRGEQLRVPGTKKVLPIIEKNCFSEGEWQPPTIQVIWGEYFKPDPDDQQKIINMVIAALGSPIPVLTVRLALQKLAPIFGIENIAAIEEQLEAEAQIRAERAFENTAREQEMFHGLEAEYADRGKYGDRGPNKQSTGKASGGSGRGSSLPKTK